MTPSPQIAGTIDAAATRLRLAPGTPACVPLSALAPRAAVGLASGSMWQAATRAYQAHAVTAAGGDWGLVLKGSARAASLVATRLAMLARVAAPLQQLAALLATAGVPLRPGSRLLGSEGARRVWDKLESSAAATEAARCVRDVVQARCAPPAPAAVAAFAGALQTLGQARAAVAAAGAGVAAHTAAVAASAVVRSIGCEPPAGPGGPWTGGTPGQQPRSTVQAGALPTVPASSTAARAGHQPLWLRVQRQQPPQQQQPQLASPQATWLPQRLVLPPSGAGNGGNCEWPESPMQRSSTSRTDSATAVAGTCWAGAAAAATPPWVARRGHGDAGGGDAKRPRYGVGTGVVGSELALGVGSSVGATAGEMAPPRRPPTSLAGSGNDGGRTDTCAAAERWSDGMCWVGPEDVPARSRRATDGVDMPPGGALPPGIESADEQDEFAELLLALACVHTLAAADAPKGMAVCRPGHWGWRSNPRVQRCAVDLRLLQRQLPNAVVDWCCQQGGGGGGRSGDGCRDGSGIAACTGTGHSGSGTTGGGGGGGGCGGGGGSSTEALARFIRSRCAALVLIEPQPTGRRPSAVLLRGWDEALLTHGLFAIGVARLERDLVRRIEARGAPVDAPTLWSMLPPHMQLYAQVARARDPLYVVGRQEFDKNSAAAWTPHGVHQPAHVR